MNFVTQVGAEVIRPAFDQAGFAVRLAGRALFNLKDLPRRLRSLLDQMYLAGVKSLLVTMYVSLFIGMIVALQVGLELARYGQQETIGPLVAVTMAREMAPLITCIILAASVASSYAAELGTMKVQEELTALEVLSIDLVSFLVLPRIVALTLMAPLLTFVADIVGVLGGGVIATQTLGIPFQGYLLGAEDALRDTSQWVVVPKNIYSGLMKATVFGFTIAVIGCASGMRASGGARGVGERTRSAVRNSIIMIIVLNLILGKVIYH